jgi:hypothetical protein
MRGISVSASLAAVSLFATTVLAEMDPIIIKGQHMFYKTNGSQFFVQGIAYQRKTPYALTKLQLTDLSQRMFAAMAHPAKVRPWLTPSPIQTDAPKTSHFSRN